MIDAARKAVGQIKKENIDEIRSLKMPPDAIRDVLEVRRHGVGGGRCSLMETPKMIWS